MRVYMAVASIACEYGRADSKIRATSLYSLSCSGRDKYEGDDEDWTKPKRLETYSSVTQDRSFNATMES